jgi:hypothetical protein
MKAMNNHPKLARGLPVLPVLGFSSMLVVGIVLYQVMVEKTWQKNLALAGYLIGVPVAVAAFVTHLSFINQLLTLSAINETTADQLQVFAAFHMHYYMTINFAIGPFFIILIGNSLMAWTAMKSNLLPKWLCYWAYFNGGLLILGMLSVVFPLLRFAQIGGPTTMLWFIALGIFLLKGSKSGRLDLTA